MDEEMHALSVACCRERPPSSSHFRVSERQRNDCLFSPSAPAGACCGLPQGHRDRTPLFRAVYHLTAATHLQPTVSVPGASHDIHTSSLKTCTWAILADRVTTLEGEHLIICSLTSGAHAASNIFIPIDGLCLRLHGRRL